MNRSHAAVVGRHEGAIGVLYDARSAHDVKVVRGVAAYLNEHRHRTVTVDGSVPRNDRLTPDQWGLRGLIAGLNQPSVAKLAASSRIPVVGFGTPDSRHHAGIPFCRTDNAQIAGMAADHLMATGFRHLAFCGYAASRGTGWSRQREDAFVGYVRARGYDPAVIHQAVPRLGTDASKLTALCAWLRRLPKSVGVMAANDVLGRHVLQACSVAHLRVPDDVAVIGVDNDDLQCQLSDPPLSSIEQDPVRLGYAAAMLLHRMLEGEVPDRPEHLVRPLALVLRRSSAPAAVTDPDVADALAFIRDRVGPRLGVRDVVAASRLSKWQLEQRFRVVVRHSIASAIRDARMMRIRDLVADATVPLKQAAAQVGFASVQHMTNAFRRAYGQTPGGYRRGVPQSR